LWFAPRPAITSPMHCLYIQLFCCVAPQTASSQERPHERGEQVISCLICCYISFT
jgi:hypothetical protein